MRAFAPPYPEWLLAQSDCMKQAIPAWSQRGKTAILRDPSAHAHWLTRTSHTSLLEDATIIFGATQRGPPDDSAAQLPLATVQQRAMSCCGTQCTAHLQ